MVSRAAGRLGSLLQQEDRERYRRQILSIEASLSSAAGSERVWKAYAETEKLIAILKFRTGYERPGVFSKLPSAKDPSKLLSTARSLLSRSSEEIQGAADPAVAIETLRGARNHLRAYLRSEALVKSARRKRSPN